MHILFLTDNFPPEVNAPASRTFEHCREWVQQGVQVTVITCAPNFPQGKVYEGYKNKLYQKEVIEGITVIRVWSYITANEGFIKRILDYISFAIMATLASLFRKFDLVIATSPQFFTAVAGYAVSVLKRKPWVMEVRDLWPESIRAVGAMSNDRLYRLLERLELFLYKKARKVVVVTDSFKENLIARGISSDKISVIKNGVLLDQFKPVEKDRALIQSLSLEGKFVVAYLGTHGMAHALDFVISSSGKLPENVCVLLIGDGAEKSKLLALKHTLKADKVHMLPPVPKSSIAQYISISDVALVNLRKSDTFKSVIPSKIFENAAMLKPVLLGVEGESQAIIEKYCAGVCFEPENEEAFQEALQKIMHPDNYLKYQQGCIPLAHDFDRKALAMKMLESINAL
ncbi:MAG: glycosyltransferase family 4 protein [Bacteroidetes bacterium]|nr:glycosyltransferase family 4 protein [Bacteroidota bacterium]